MKIASKISTHDGRAILGCLLSRLLGRTNQDLQEISWQTSIPLQDPTKQYPTPKFKHQPQSVPGLAKKMFPKPDHGETSYRGSGRLPNRKALVTGGDSGIGRAAAIAFAREGADVVINYLPSEERDAKEVIALIEAEGHKAFAIPGDISNEKFARKLVKDAHRKLGGLDVLACVAGK